MCSEEGNRKTIHFLGILGVKVLVVCLPYIKRSVISTAELIASWVTVGIIFLLMGWPISQRQYSV